MRELNEVGGKYHPSAMLGDTSVQRAFTGPDDVDDDSAATLAKGDAWFQAGPAAQVGPPPPPPPSFAPFWGLAYGRQGTGGNLTPAVHEAAAGRPVGCNRTYFNANQQAAGITQAKADTAAGRVPWISYVFPNGVADVISGGADAWAQDIYTRCATVPGPMLLTFGHEGNLSTKNGGASVNYAKAHDRLYQLKGSTAPKCKVGPIVTGFEVVFGSTDELLATMWPGTLHADFLGCDAYSNYKTEKPDGSSPNNSSNWYLSVEYYTPIARFAALKGVDWAWGETGWGNDAAAWDRTNHGGVVSWIQDMYDGAISVGTTTGSKPLAICYFDDDFNTSRYDISSGGTIAAWPLSNDHGTPSKSVTWVSILQDSPVWRSTW